MDHFKCDFLIIGTGIAALRAAIELADFGQVLILTKSGSKEGSTLYAQGGIAAAIGDEDSPERHAADTLAAGDGLCRQDAVCILTEEGPRYVQELIRWGAKFDRNKNGTPSLAREGGHTVRRVLHSQDATGKEICRVLWSQVRRHTAVRVIEHAWVVDVVVSEGRCVAARFRDPSGRLSLASASATLLATGGAGQLYSETTNPAVATGDGIAIAYRAGASVIDLEFVQFHPTALAITDHPRFLLSEALRGEGARLVNESGEGFMDAIDPAGDLAPRDRVARGIAREVERTGGQVYLTLDRRPRKFVERRFPLIATACRTVGLDLARDRVPVGPAAHYVMGGVETDLDGRTTVPGLFAAGEVACTGAHGANRLASNSLLEGLVFGALVGRAMRTSASRHGLTEVPSGALGSDPVGHPSDELPSEQEVRELMWQKVGLFRDGAKLKEAVTTFDLWASILLDRSRGGSSLSTASLITTGQLVARAALRREESRGAHFRSDFPSRNDIDWSRRVGESRPSEL